MRIALAPGHHDVGGGWIVLDSTFENNVALNYGITITPERNPEAMPAKTKKKAPPNKSTTDRLDIIEKALGANGIDLSEFDPQIVLERRQAAEAERVEAIAQADADAEAALGKPLTDDERRDRVEAALRSQGLLDAAPEAA